MPSLEQYLKANKEKLSSLLVDANSFKSKNQGCVELLCVASLQSLRSALGLHFDLERTSFYPSLRHEAYSPGHPYVELGPPEDRREMKRLKAGEVNLTSVHPFGDVKFDIYILFMQSDTFTTGGSPGVFEGENEYLKMLWEFPKNKVLPLGFYFPLKRLIPVGPPQNYYSLAQEGSIEFIELIVTFAHEFAHLFQDMRVCSLLQKRRNIEANFKKVFASESKMMDMYNEACANMAGFDSLVHFLNYFGSLIPDDYKFSFKKHAITWAEMKRTKLEAFKEYFISQEGPSAWRYKATENFFEWREGLGEEIFDKTLEELFEDFSSWKFTKAAFEWPDNLENFGLLSRARDSEKTWDWVRRGIEKNY